MATQSKKHRGQKTESGKKHERGHSGSGQGRMQGNDKGEKSGQSNRTNRGDPDTDDQR